MAIQFHELPVEVFNPEAQPFIARLNRELRELFALESVLRNPVSAKRSDQTIVRRSQPQVDVSRITPPITNVVSGQSTVVGTPALVLGTLNAVGSTTTAVSVNSQVALFGTQAPVGYSTAAATGSSAFAARADFVLPYPEALGTSASRSKSVTLTDDVTDGALLTCAPSFSANVMSFLAPNANQPFSIGRWGNIAGGGVGAPLDPVLILLSKTYSAGDISGGGAPQLMKLLVTNSSDQVPAFPYDMASFTVTHSPLIGSSWGSAKKLCTLFGGQVNINNTSVGTSTSFAGYSIKFSNGQANIVDMIAPFLSLQVSSGVGRNITNLMHFFAVNNTVAGTLTRQSLIGQTASWTSGTTKRSLDAINTAEVNGNDFLASTSDKGLITKDSQGTPEFWRFYVKGTGVKGASISVDSNGFISGTRDTSATGSVIMNLQDAGTTAPAA